MTTINIRPNVAYSLIRKHVPHLMDPHGLASVLCCQLAESGKSIDIYGVHLSVDKYDDRHDIKLSGEMQQIRKLTQEVEKYK